MIIAEEQLVLIFIVHFLSLIFILIRMGNLIYYGNLSKQDTTAGVFAHIPFIVLNIVSMVCVCTLPKVIQ